MIQDARAFNWDSIPVKTGTTANPAAGANAAVVTVPAGKRWLFCGCGQEMVTAVAAANRYPYLEVKHDGTNTTFLVYSPTPQVASQDVFISFVPGGTTGGLFAAVGAYSIGFAATELPAGGTFQIKWLDIQGADDGNVVQYAYKEVPA